MSSKRQFLDPIGAGCKLILLYFSDPGTKIRISGHMVQLVSNEYAERILYRPWIYGDSRDDMCVLYPVIVRFIELYLIEKKNRRNSLPHIVQTTIVSSPKGGQFGALFDDVISEEEHNNNDNELSFSDATYECLKKLAKYMIEGLGCLEKTYGYDNAVFTLQYYSNLLRSGIDGSYKNELLPTHLRDLSQNLLDTSKIKNLWKDANIISLTGLFDKCFEAHRKGDVELMKGYKAAIMECLNIRDNEFKEIVTNTESA